MGAFFTIVNLFFKDLPEEDRKTIVHMVTPSFNSKYNLFNNSIFKQLTTKGQNYDNGYINQKWLSDIVGGLLYQRFLLPLF